MIVAVISWIACACLAFPPAWAAPRAPFRRYSPIVSFNLDPIANLNTSIRIAARENRTADLRKLLEEAGADVNSRSDDGFTALMNASRYCFPKAARILLRKGADVNIRDIRGRTAFMHAIREGCVAVVRMLMRAPATRFDMKDKKGRSLLDYARTAAEPHVEGNSVKILRIVENAVETLKRRKSGN